MPVGCSEHEHPATIRLLAKPRIARSDDDSGWNTSLAKPALDACGRPLTPVSQEISSAIHEFRVRAGVVYTLEVDVKNTGLQPWFGHVRVAPVNASYRWLDANGNILPIEGNRALLNRSIRPGENHSLILQVVPPPTPGSYTLWVSMVSRGGRVVLCSVCRTLALRATVECAHHKASPMGSSDILID